MSFIPVVVRENLVHFIGKQGCTWSCNLTLHQAGTCDLIDLTDYSIRGQIRKTYADTAPIAVFTCTKVDDLAGKLTILLEADTTAALTACKTSVDSTNYTSADKSGQYVYDVEIYEGIPEAVYWAIQGIIFVDVEVTK